MIWILILIMHAENRDPDRAVSIEFNSKEACLQAGELFKRHGEGNDFICVYKGLKNETS